MVSTSAMIDQPQLPISLCSSVSSQYSGLAMIFSQP